MVNDPLQLAAAATVPCSGGPQTQPPPVPADEAPTEHRGGEQEEEQVRHLAIQFGVGEEAVRKVLHQEKTSPLGAKAWPHVKAIEVFQGPEGVR